MSISFIHAFQLQELSFYYHSKVTNIIYKIIFLSILSLNLKIVISTRDDLRKMMQDDVWKTGPEHKIYSFQDTLCALTIAC